MMRPRFSDVQKMAASALSIASASAAISGTVLMWRAFHRADQYLQVRVVVKEEELTG
jgi:hypothetical protein